MSLLFECRMTNTWQAPTCPTFEVDLSWNIDDQSKRIRITFPEESQLAIPFHKQSQFLAELDILIRRYALK